MKRNKDTKLILILMTLVLTSRTCYGQSKEVKRTFEQHLRKSAVSKNVIDTFLDPARYSWAQFDPDLGYILGNYMPRDGIDKSSTISTVQPNGARTARMYTDKPCRINTYGNSFTQCHQVSDGETWQEYLAAHLGEPVRNFGMGGYGVYQAYRRMLREEQTELGAEYVILYIWGDDHIRSLLRCRHALTCRSWDEKGGKLFHGNFWPNVKTDLKTGKFVEHDNILSTPESLYKMMDPDWMYQNLKDDLALQMYAYLLGYIGEVDTVQVQNLARALNFKLVGSLENKQTIRNLLDKYSLEATKYVLEKAKMFTEEKGKKLLVVLFDPRVMGRLITTGSRYDQEIVDFLVKNDFRYFDMNVVHAEDYKCFKLSFGEYRKRYFIGHYNPRGNHFFAYSIKDKIVEWLDPKPITYRDSDQKMIDFKGYLE